MCVGQSSAPQPNPSLPPLQAMLTLWAGQAAGFVESPRRTKRPGLGDCLAHRPEWTSGRRGESHGTGPGDHPQGCPAAAKSPKHRYSTRLRLHKTSADPRCREFQRATAARASAMPVLSDVPVEVAQIQVTPIWGSDGSGQKPYTPLRKRRLYDILGAKFTEYFAEIQWVSAMHPWRCHLIDH